jgi:hypothetical protein
MNDPNRRLLVDAARVLQPLLGDLVFVGGCATGLLISDPAAADVRPTKGPAARDRRRRPGLYSSSGCRWSSISLV